LNEASLPPPATIRETAEAIVARPYFDLGTARSSGPPLWLQILRWIWEPFRMLFDSMEGLPDWLRWVIVVLAVALCAALVAHIVYSFVTAIRGPRRRGAASLRIAQARELRPEDLERDAELADSTGDHIGAVRLLFRAALRRIELAEEKRFRPGLTNRELLRRYQTSPLFPSLQRFIDIIELKWYGGQKCVAGDYSACRSEHQPIRQIVERRQHALGA
jgi:hypothetical protein